MEFVIKEFSSLTSRELYEIYFLRSEVFVVEQNCVYQDVDNKDLSAIHVMLLDKTTLVGYTRILPPGISYKEPSIGRVALKQSARGNGTGKLLMNQSMNKTLELFKDQDIIISAQSYLKKFYTDLKFKTEGEEYLEDAIPHIKMRFKPV